jgi:hypothetical protein
MMTSLFDRYLEQNDAFAGRGKPELGKAHYCLKIVLVAINVVFLIFGCVLMGVGSYAYNNHSLGTITGATLPLGIVTLGVFIMFLSFLGWCSAWRESRIFLGIYFFFLVLMTFLLLCVGSAVYAKKNEARSYIDSGWQGAPDDVRASLQGTFGCCGLNYWNDSFAVQPCPAGPDIVANISCGDTIADQFYKQFNTVGTCGIVFAVLMTVCVTFVCCLIRGIRLKNAKADISGLSPGDDSANPTTVPDPNTPGATASAAAAQPAGTTLPANPPPVSTQV